LKPAFASGDPGYNSIVIMLPKQLKYTAGFIPNFAHLYHTQATPTCFG